MIVGGGGGGNRRTFEKRAKKWMVMMTCLFFVLGLVVVVKGQRKPKREKDMYTKGGKYVPHDLRRHEIRDTLMKERKELHQLLEEAKKDGHDDNSERISALRQDISRLQAKEKQLENKVHDDTKKHHELMRTRGQIIDERKKAKKQNGGKETEEMRREFTTKFKRIERQIQDIRLHHYKSSAKEREAVHQARELVHDLATEMKDAKLRREDEQVVKEIRSRYEEAKEALRLLQAGLHKRGHHREL